MSKVGDDIVRLAADQVTIKAGIAGLNTQIKALKDQLAAGTTVTADQVTALDQLATDADALAGTFPVSSDAPPAPPVTAA